MKEYLKMSDVFVVDGYADFAVLLPMSVRPEHDDCVTPHDYAAHAINSHDELVAEVDRLRSMVIRMQAYLDMAGEYPEKESDNPVRQWLFDAIDCAK